MGVLDSLPLNKKFEIEIPQDMIPVEGIDEVNRYLTEQFLEGNRHLREYAEYDRFINRDFPRDWVLSKKSATSKYTGTFTKRVAAFLYNERQLKLTAEQQSEIGNIARRHCTKNSKFVFDFVAAFDWKSGDFGDGGSCYWGGNRLARRVLQYYGGRAIRFYRPDNKDKGLARAWLAPLKLARITDKQGNLYTGLSEDDLAQMLIAFNGYGHETQRIARVLSTHLGLSYTKVHFTYNGATNGTLWINHYNDGDTSRSASFLIGPTHLIDKVGRVDVRWKEDDVDRVDCAGGCGRRERTNNLREHDGQFYCSACVDRLFATCTRCSSFEIRADVNQVIVGTLRGLRHETWCKRCTAEHAFACSHCGKWFTVNIKILAESGDQPWCRICFTEQHRQCDECQEWKTLNEYAGEGKRCRKCQGERQERRVKTR